jgi:hypothetical protein
MQSFFVLAVQSHIKEGPAEGSKAGRELICFACQYLKALEQTTSP